MTSETSFPRRITTLLKEGLPQVASAHAEATRHLLALLARITMPLRLSVRELGVVDVSFGHVVDPTRPYPFADSDETFWIVGAGRDDPARLTVPGELALRLTSAIVGLPDILLPRALGPVEKGILTSLVALALGKSGLGARLRADPPKTLTAGALTLVLRIGYRAGSGLVSLTLPATWLQDNTTRPITPSLTSAFTNLDLVLRMEAARTLLDAPAWADAGPGDVVVFDGVAPLLSPGLWTLSLSLGDKFALATLDPDGRLKLMDRFKSRPERIRMTIPTPQSAASPSDQATFVVAAAPVEVVAELGRIVLRADELLGLVQGAALSFGTRSLDGVLLRVGDRPWARGELVVIDDELGVRITAVLPEAKR